jgi:hypothetical protein
VKYAEDQHKKKELSRLHNLTTGNPYRGLSLGGSALHSGAVPGPSMGPTGPKMRDGKGLSLNLGGDMTPTYYYQQQGLGGMYGGPPSPIQILHPPMSPLSPGPPLSSHSLGQMQQSMYMSSSQMPMGPSEGGKRGMNNFNRGRKSVPFPLDIPLGGGDQSPNWFSSMGGLGSIHMPPPYLQSPVSHHLQQHMSLALMSPSSQSSTQSPLSHQLRPPQRHHNQGGHGSLGSLHSPNASYSGGSVTLTVHNLHPQADAALLHELFAPYGKILSAQVETERGTGRGGGGLCTGRGRVQMAGFAQAEYAAQGDDNDFVSLRNEHWNSYFYLYFYYLSNHPALNGALIYEGGLPIHVSSFKKKKLF